MKALIISLCLAIAILSWNPNTESDVAGYNVYSISWFHWAIGDDNWHNIFDVGDVTRVALFWLAAGYLYDIYVTAYDFAGNESGPSRSKLFINRR